MKAVLAPDCTFADVQSKLVKAGWKRLDLAGLKEPLRPGEPETAMFERKVDGATLSYSFNPALDLRMIESGSPDGTDVLERVSHSAIECWIQDVDPKTALRGLHAASALRITELKNAAKDAADRLPDDLKRFAQQAIVSLMPSSIEKPESQRALGVATFATFPLLMRRAVLRTLLAEEPGTAAPLLSGALDDADAELAAIAAVGAARLGRSELIADIAASSLDAAQLDRRARARFRAIKSIAIDVLESGSNPPEPAAKTSFRNSLLGLKGEAGDDAFFAALMEPPPEISPVAESQRHGLVFHAIGCSRHWVGSEDHKGDEICSEPIREWTPPAAFAVSVTAFEEMLTIEEAREALASLSHELALKIRLPTAIEWEASMRGPSGWPRPWGLSAVRPPGFSTGPWGLVASGDAGEWVTHGEKHLVMGAKLKRHLAERVLPSAPTRAFVRPVMEWSQAT